MLIIGKKEKKKKKEVQQHVAVEIMH